LLESNAIIFRLIDPEQFTGSRTTPYGGTIGLEVTHTGPDTKLHLVANDTSHELAPWFLDRVTHTPTALADMRTALLACADVLLATARGDADTHEQGDQLPKDDEATNSPPGEARLAKGDDVTYGTVYKHPSTDGACVLVYEVPNDVSDKRLHIAWDPDTTRIFAFYVDGILRDLSEEDQRELGERIL
jgi:hypothetical protein